MRVELHRNEKDHAVCMKGCTLPLTSDLAGLPGDFGRERDPAASGCDGLRHPGPSCKSEKQKHENKMLTSDLRTNRALMTAAVLGNLVVPFAPSGLMLKLHGFGHWRVSVALALRVPTVQDARRS